MLYYWLYRNSQLTIDKLEDYICAHFENMGYVTLIKHPKEGVSDIKVWQGSAFWGRGEVTLQIMGNQTEFWFIFQEKGLFAAEFEGGFTAKKKQVKLNKDVHDFVPLIQQWTQAQVLQHYQADG